MNLRYKIAAVVIATLTTITSACSSTKSDDKDYDPNLDDSSVGVEKESIFPDAVVIEGKLQRVTVGLACGASDELTPAAAHIREDGHLVVPGAEVTFSVVEEANGDVEQKFFRAPDANGVFELAEYVKGIDSKNLTDVTELYVGDENGIGEGNTGMVLDYTPEGHDGAAYAFLIDYFGTAMRADVINGDGTILNRSVDGYIDRTRNDPTVGNFVDPADVHYTGNLENFNGKDSYLKRKVGPVSTYSQAWSVDAVTGEVGVAETTPVNGVQCASAIVIAPVARVY